MSAAYADIHVSAGDVTKARYVPMTQPHHSPHIVVRWADDDHARLFLPADVPTLDQLLAALDAARVAVAIDQGVPA